MNVMQMLPVKTLAVLSVLLVVACSDAPKLEANELVKDTPSDLTNALQNNELTVYKSNTCHCCQKWVDHVEQHGFNTDVQNIVRLSEMKDLKGIHSNYRSCHTAISKDGYAFEGHVPAKFIQQFLNQTHGDNVIGLSVPGMPVGTPGMEVDNKFNPYNVLLLKSDGTSEVYANVLTFQEQF